MKTYIMFDNDQIKFIPVDMDLLRREGSIEIDGVKYSSIEFHSIHEAMLNSEQIQVVILNRKRKE